MKILEMKKLVFLASVLFLQILNANELCFRYYKSSGSESSSGLKKSGDAKERVRAYRKNIETILSEENVKRSSDSLHGAWQKSTTYLTRYKLMADKMGNPILDFKGFVLENKIPEKYWEFYRKNSDGKYEEDLVAVPNKYLSYGSYSKNLIGSRSILRQVAELMVSSPRSVGEAYDMVIKALQVTHEDWLRMNPWAKGSRPDHILDLIPDLGLTNASGPYTLFSEAMNYSDPAHLRILEGFHRHQDNLQKKRIGAYGQQNIESVYLDLILKKGTKVPMDEHLEHFFDSKMKMVKMRVPVDEKQSSKEVAEVYQTQLAQEIRSSLKISGDFRLKAPDTPPGSGARVYLVIDTEGKVAGALKIQSKNFPSKFAGLDELISALTVEKFITENRPGVQIARTVDHGQLSDNSYFSIIEPARERDLDGWLKTLVKPDSVSLILQTSAQTLAHLHSPGTGAMQSRDVYETLKGNGLYETRKLREYVSNVSLQNETQEMGVSKEVISLVKAQVKIATESYERILDRQLSDFSPSTTHGDFHGGNIFYSLRENKSTMIDAGTLTWTVASTGDPANDLGRIMGHMLVEDLKHARVTDVTFARAKEFYRNYILSARIEIGSKKEQVLSASVAFYLNRYFAIQAGDLAGKKFSSPDLAQPELMGRLYDLWLQLHRLDVSQDISGQYHEAS